MASPEFKQKGAILLVEDDQEDVEIIELALETIQSPNRLITVSNGREAMWYLSRQGEYADRRQYPDPMLMLLDLSLPQMNGLEVLAWMRGEAPETMPPVVVLTSSRDDQNRYLAHKFGAKGYFVKSADLYETVAMFKSLLLLNWLPGQANI